MNNKNIVLTGGTGFLGKNLIKHLIHNNRCFNLGRNKKNFCENIYWDLYTDINYENMPKNIDTIIHCASIVGVNTSIEKNKYIDINIKATVKLLEYAIKNNAEHFVYISTGGVYGFTEKELTEDSLCKPQDIYSITKYISELICNYYSKKIKITILRLFFPYGINQEGRLIYNLINNIVNKKYVNLNSGGLPVINPIHIKDVCNIIEEVMNLKLEGTFNISGNEEISIGEICELIAKRADIKDLQYAYTNNGCKNLIGCNKKIINKLNYTMDVNIESGLNEIFGKYILERRQLI